MIAYPANDGGSEKFGLEILPPKAKCKRRRRGIFVASETQKIFKLR
jgi:hypothetical protein